MTDKIDAVRHASEASAMMALHNWAMSDDPRQARFGRVMKEAYPVIREAFYREADRGMNTHDLVIVLQSTMTSLAANLITDLCPDEVQGDCLIAVANGFNEGLKQLEKQMRERQTFPVVDLMQPGDEGSGL